MIRAVVDAAYLEKKPVVIQIHRRLLDDKMGEYLSEIIKYIAEDIDIPIVLHLDHGVDLIQIRKALDYEFTSVMIDGSALSFDENVLLVKKTRELIDLYGLGNKVSIEGELGGIPSAMGYGSSDNYKFTDPDEAEAFVKLTNIDALAIAFGTAHGIYTSKPKLNFELLKEISKRVNTPLVLHGGTGISNECIIKSIKYGIKKVNIATELQKFYIDGIVDAQTKSSGSFLPWDILTRQVRDNLTDLIRSKIKLVS
jgi:fructose-bisphosphate aldolase class II